MENKVATYRNAGLEAKWGTSPTGAPCIYLRDPQSSLKHQRESWWRVDKAMFDRMKEVGVKEGFHQATILGDIFSI